MSDVPTLNVVRGADVERWLPDVARLRVNVFREWPYLYEGNDAYERDYLAAYAQSPDSVFVLALDGERVVGASTALPLVDDSEAFRAPFRDTHIDPGEVFYFGESVLSPEYRGRGIGHAFFDARQAHARSFGTYRWTAFCAVDREADDPRRPRDHRDNTAFWTSRGYARQPGLSMQLDWNETGRGEIAHALTFWLRPLEPRA